MTGLIKIVEIAQKLEKCYKSAKFLYGDLYSEKIQWFKHRLKEHATNHKKDILPSVVDICQNDLIKENGMATLLFMAAAYDLVELEKYENS